MRSRLDLRSEEGGGGIRGKVWEGVKGEREGSERGEKREGRWRGNKGEREGKRKKIGGDWIKRTLPLLLMQIMRVPASSAERNNKEKVKKKKAVFW